MRPKGTFGLSDLLSLLGILPEPVPLIKKSLFQFNCPDRAYSDTSIAINAFAVQNLLYKFLLTLATVLIWSGISWMALLVYLLIIVPGYLSPAYSWVTLYSFLIFLSVKIIVDMLKGINAVQGAK